MTTRLRPSPRPAHVNAAARQVGGVRAKRVQLAQWIQSHPTCDRCAESDPACYVLTCEDPAYPCRQIQQWIRDNYRWSRILSWLTSHATVRCQNCRAKAKRQTLTPVHPLAAHLVSQDRAEVQRLRSAWLRARWRDPSDPLQQHRARIHSPEHLASMREKSRQRPK